MASVPVEPLRYSESEVASALGPSWKETLRQAYEWMAFARVLDDRMLGFQRQGRVGFYGPATGHEAVNVAAGLATTPDDWIFPGLREQLVALVRGHPLSAYVHHLFGNAKDPALGRNMPCHPTAREVHYVSMSSVVGTQISQAVGTAFGLKYRRSKGVSLAFFGDGATSSNDFHAGLNFAAVFRLPVLFCCVNNRWAISLPVERQTSSETLAAKARTYGLPGHRVDGTDFVATYSALADALGRVRRAGEPEMIEFLAYRMVAHSSSDDPRRYQPSDWDARARARDPFARLEGWLAARGLLSEADRDRVRATAESRVRAAVRGAETEPLPSPGSMTEDVYAPGLSRTPHPS